MQLKQNSTLQRYMQMDEFIVRESTFNHKCALKEAELKRRAEALDRREKELNEKEAKLLAAQRETMKMQQNLMGKPKTALSSAYPTSHNIPSTRRAGTKGAVKGYSNQQSAYTAISGANARVM